MTLATLRYSATRFPSPVVRRREAGDFVLSETRYESEACLPTHIHEYACVVVVLGGSFQERQETRTRLAGPGTVIVRPEGEPHSDRFNRDGGGCLNVELLPRWLARMHGVTVRSTLVSGVPWALLGRRLHLELVNGDDLSALAVESLVLEILVGLGRAERLPIAGAPPWLLRVRDRIHSDPAARTTLADLAAEAGVHPVHLAASFRRYFGRPLASTIRQLRLELACRTLSETDAPIADVAIHAGFADQSHLGRALKRAMQVTPRALRAAARPRPAARSVPEP